MDLLQYSDIYMNPCLSVLSLPSGAEAIECMRQEGQYRVCKGKMDKHDQANIGLCFTNHDPHLIHMKKTGYVVKTI